MKLPSLRPVKTSLGSVAAFARGRNTQGKPERWHRRQVSVLSATTHFIFWRRQLTTKAYELLFSITWGGKGTDCKPSVLFGGLHPTILGPYDYRHVHQEISCVPPCRREETEQAG